MNRSSEHFAEISKPTFQSNTFKHKKGSNGSKRKHGSLVPSEYELVDTIVKNKKTPYGMGKVVVRMLVKKEKTQAQKNLPIDEDDEVYGKASF